MAELRSTSRTATSASFVLGRKLDSIPFSPYHMMVIAVFGLGGFVDDYDLALTRRETVGQLETVTDGVPALG